MIFITRIIFASSLALAWFQSCYAEGRRPFFICGSKVVPKANQVLPKNNVALERLILSSQFEQSATLANTALIPPLKFTTKNKKEDNIIKQLKFTEEEKMILEKNIKDLIALTEKNGIKLDIFLARFRDDFVFRDQLGKKYFGKTAPFMLVKIFIGKIIGPLVEKMSNPQVLNDTYKKIAPMHKKMGLELGAFLNLKSAFLRSLTDIFLYGFDPKETSIPGDLISERIKIPRNPEKPQLEFDALVDLFEVSLEARSRFIEKNKKKDSSIVAQATEDRPLPCFNESFEKKVELEMKRLEEEERNLERGREEVEVRLEKERNELEKEIINLRSEMAELKSRRPGIELSALDLAQPHSKSGDILRVDTIPLNRKPLITGIVKTEETEKFRKNNEQKNSDFKDSLYQKKIEEYERVYRGLQAIKVWDKVLTASAVAMLHYMSKVEDEKGEGISNNMIAPILSARK